MAQTFLRISLGMLFVLIYMGHIFDHYNKEEDTNFKDLSLL